MRTDIASVFVCLLSLAAGHGAVTSYTITSGGTSVDYPGYEGYSPASSPDTIEWQWSTYDPVYDVTDPRMLCNGGTSAELSAPINAGDSITAHWKQWTHSQGPVMVWLYPCAGDFSSCTGTEQSWVKIDQLGLYGDSLTSEDWGTGIVVRELEWTSVIPTNIEPGNYLIRHELLALHQANTPQFYPECAQLAISSDGDAFPPAEFQKKIPGYAPQNDPGITIDIYSSTATTYTCPGGDVWGGWTF